MTAATGRPVQAVGPRRICRGHAAEGATGEADGADARAGGKDGERPDDKGSGSDTDGREDGGSAGQEG